MRAELGVSSVRAGGGRGLFEKHHFVLENRLLGPGRRDVSYHSFAFAQSAR